MFDSLTGVVESGQLRIECPLCHKENCYLSLGDSDNILANCFTPSCSGKGLAVLRALSLPARILFSEEKRAFLDEVLEGKHESHKALPPARCPDELHKYYSLWLSRCPLLDEDRQLLLDRGFRPEHLEQLGYGSWRGKMSAVGFPKEGVPGVHHGKVAFTGKDYHGTIIPVRDHERRVVALKLRLHREDGRGKMRLFSSSYCGGAMGSYCPHLPVLSPQRSDEVTVTEGELKADLYAALTGRCVIGVPGARGAVAGAVGLVVATGADSVLLAFDQDDAGREATRRYQEAMPDARRLSWDQAYKGIDDAQVAGAIIAEDGAPPPPSDRWKGGDGRRSLAGLLATDFPPVPWVVPGLLPPGLTILAAKPKIGKSLLCLDLAIAVANGSFVLDDGYVACKSPTLYFDLEANARLSQARARKLLSGREGFDTSNIFLYNTDSRVPRMPEFIPFLKNVWEECGGPRLVILDTWVKLRPLKGDASVDYTTEYDSFSALKAFADERSIAVVIVHHLRKDLKNVDDIYDGVLGSTALTGAVDTMMLLNRKRDESGGHLIYTGREVEHTELPLTLDHDVGQWFVNSQVVSLERRLTAREWLVKLLEDGEPLLLKDILAMGQEAGYKKENLHNQATKIPNLLKETGDGVTTWRLVR